MIWLILSVDSDMAMIRKENIEEMKEREGEQTVTDERDSRGKHKIQGRKKQILNSVMLLFTLIVI